MSGRRDFLNQPAPENYVAGLGRGATGFTTRSDLGPAREGPSEDQIKEALAKRAAQLGFGDAIKKDDKNDDNDERYQDPDNEVGLFAGGIYDKDDDEADRIYREIDEKMDRRRKARREAREQAEREEYERQNPKIAHQFADLKRGLEGITEDEWAAIPEVGDLTGKNRRNKQARQQRFYAVPDSVLAAAGSAGELGTTIADDGAATNGSSEASDGTMTNFAKIGEARDKVLQVRLDQASQSGTSTVSGSATSVDPKGYLTSLTSSSLPQSAAQVGDINRARELLESVIKTNPNNAPGWIAAARLEELAGKTVAARNVIARGCEKCPRNEDVWLENIRLNDARNAKIIAANAISKNNRSVRLWVQAMSLETEPRSKKRVIRQALDHIPESEALWKEAVNLEEDPADARLLLAKATELIPLSVDLWLALAHLETPEKAQVVLNKARKHCPTSHEIWIAAARLQEQLADESKVNLLMKRAITMLAKESAMPKRENWIGEAEKCEAEGAIMTCNAIVRETLGWGLDEDDDRKDIWLEDARGSINRGNYQTARAIYAYALRVFATSRTVWLAAIDLERAHGSMEELCQALEKAVNACPRSEEMWMMLAKEKWMAGEVDSARLVLARAFQQNPNSEDLWLAAVKLEAENDQQDHARKLLADARQEAPTDRVWMKSAAFERQLGNLDTALDLVQQALNLFPSAAKLWMMKGQIYEDIGKPLQAREAYGTGVKAVPSSVPLWLLYSRLEEKLGQLPKARSVLDRARLAVPKSAELWCESVRVERRAQNMKQAETLMERALRDVPKPNQGILWSEKIWHLTPRPQRKNKALEGIKEVDSDPALLTAVGRIFWGERRLEKALTWFEKALVRDADLGDTWAWYYKFLLEHGTEEKRAEVISKCVSVEPRHGETWQAVAKDPKNARKGPEELLKLVAAELR
ncbi:PRP1 splicing factor [Microdochium trichocladiopsis]|uniref:PRP1 splicing factor n=1 Tax=Microdochium trichocladiopsis TaxID=1682393 RepID=A0A9P8Y3A3_9PEZI|nr:PRP1 splicing factor [Microdochium trichocladiopsis]KAH7026407.1 PRP1 splicing factor [Microdochium trichocladiopsis]